MASLCKQNTTIFERRASDLRRVFHNRGLVNCRLDAYHALGEAATTLGILKEFESDRERKPRAQFLAVLARGLVAARVLFPDAPQGEHIAANKVRIDWALEALARFVSMIPGRIDEYSEWQKKNAIGTLEVCIYALASNWRMRALLEEELESAINASVEKITFIKDEKDGTYD